MRGVGALVALVVVFAAPAWATYDAKGHRAPMIPLVTQEGVLREPQIPGGGKASLRSGPTLEGIVFDRNGASIALIDGEVYRQGDAREGVEVLTIEPTRVVMRKDGAEQELRLPAADAGGA